MAEKLNIYSDGKTFHQLIDLTIQVLKSGRVPFIWGPPGTGKSALTKYVAEKLSCEFRCLDAPLLQPFDYAVAVPDHNTKEIVLYRTGFIPQKGPCIVSIEDLPHAKPYQQVPVMQIVLDHRIGPLKFADDVHFIASGNREEDLAYTQPIPSPLLNRFVHFDLKPDVEEWVYRFAKPNKLDDRIIGFTLANPEFFVQIPKEGVRSWSTPRSLHAFAEIIKNISDENDLRSLGIATIGEVPTKFFLEWLKYLRGLDPRTVVERGVLPKYNTSDRSQVFAIVLSVANYITKLGSKEILKYGQNIMKFFDSITSDYKILFCHQFIEYDTCGNRNVDKITILQKIRGADKIFTELATTLLG